LDPQPGLGLGLLHKIRPNFFRILSSVWNKKELPQQWKESIMLPNHKRVIRLIVIIIAESPYYQLLTKFYLVLLDRLTPFANEIIGDHHCGFRRYSSITDQIFYIWQILEKKREYNGKVHQLFTTSRKRMTQLREKFFTIFCLNLAYLRS
jgi:hypothetical protein